MMSSQADDEDEMLFDQTGLLNNKSKPRLSSQWCHNFTKTLFLSVAFFVLGLCIAIPGPTLLDLGDRVGADIKSITWIFTTRSIGYLLGSIVGGFLFDCFDKQMLLCYTLLLTSVATIAIPWCLTLIVLSTMTSIQGVAMGILDTGGNMFCIHIWKKKSGPYMQTLHFAFGIGAFIAPLLAKPFLTPVSTNHSIVLTGNIPTLTHLPGQVYLEPDLNNSAVLFRHVRQDNTLFSNSTTQAILDMNKTTTVLPKKPQVASDKHLKPNFNDGRHMKEVKIVTKETDKEEQKSNQPTVIVNHTLSNDTEFDNLQGNFTTDQNSTSAQVASISSLFTSTPTTAKTMISTRTQHLIELIPDTNTVPPTPTPPTKTLPAKTQTPQTQTKTQTPTNTLPQQTKNVSIDTDTVTPSTTVNISEVYKKPETVTDVFGDAIDAVRNMSKIQFAYLIIGILLFVTSMLFLGLYCANKHQPLSVPSTEEMGHVTRKDSLGFRVTILFLLFLFFFMYVGMEVTFGGLILSFSVKYLNWTKDRGTIVTAIFWGALATGRGFAIFVAKCFSPPCMLIVDLLFCLIATLILSFGLSLYEPMLWLGTLLFGLGMSSVFPAGVSWAEQYLHLTGKSTSVFVVGSALGEMVIPIITGQLFQFVSMMSLMYVMLLLTIVALILYIIMQTIVSRRGNLTMRVGSMRTLKGDNTLNLESTNYGTDVFEGLYKRNKSKHSYEEVEYGLLDQELED